MHFKSSKLDNREKLRTHTYTHTLLIVCFFIFLSHAEEILSFFFYFCFCLQIFEDINYIYLLNMHKIIYLL